MSVMELDGFGYKMKEFLGIFKGELIEYRIKIQKSKDVFVKDQKTGAKVFSGNQFLIEKDKMGMIVQATQDKDYLKVMLVPEKKDKLISDEFIDIINKCLGEAREELIKRGEKKASDYKEVTITKISQPALEASEEIKSLNCIKCHAPLPPVRRGNVVCPYCDTTNVIKG